MSYPGPSEGQTIAKTRRHPLLEAPACRFGHISGVKNVRMNKSRMLDSIIFTVRIPLFIDVPDHFPIPWFYKKQELDLILHRLQCEEKAKVVGAYHRITWESVYEFWSWPARGLLAAGRAIGSG
jgi:hypothetical protein